MLAQGRNGIIAVLLVFDCPAVVGNAARVSVGIQ
jgi:hypothetical protein